MQDHLATCTGTVRGSDLAYRDKACRVDGSAEAELIGEAGLAHAYELDLHQASRRRSRTGARTAASGLR